MRHRRLRPVRLLLSCALAAALLGLGAGLLFGFMLTRITEIQSYDTRSAVYGGSVLVFGGLGLIVSFIVERALSRRR